MRPEGFPCHVGLGHGAICIPLEATVSTCVAFSGLGENRGPLGGFQASVRTEYVF